MKSNKQVAAIHLLGTEVTVIANANEYNEKIETVRILMKPTQFDGYLIPLGITTIISSKQRQK